jgi:hypothetical protein
LKVARADFPRSSSATYLQIAIAQNGRAVFDWLMDGDAGMVPVFDPWEIAFARQFETGVFPPITPSPEQVDYYITRSLEIAAGSGREFPSGGDLRSAIAEVFGGNAP